MTLPRPHIAPETASGTASDSLRLRLRRDTADAHARIDGLAAPLELGRRLDLVRFLRAHASANAALARRNASLSGMLERRASLARADLRSLGADSEPPSLPPASQGAPIGATGLLYVIAGSHLGARQLVRAVRSSPDAGLHGATALLDDTDLAGQWKTLVAELRAASPAGPEADRVVADARETFAAFERAFRAALAE